MRNITLTSLLVLIFAAPWPVHSGQSKGQSHIQIKKTSNGSQWITVGTDQSHSVQDIFDATKDLLGLGSGDEMVNVRESKDRTGASHYVFRQHYQGVPVELAEMRVHARENVVYKMSGVVVPGLIIDPDPFLSEDEALQFALDHTAAEHYLWENGRMEALLKHQQQDPEATYYPSGMLVVAFKENDLSAEHARLAYEFDIYSSQPWQRNYVYIDAHTGDVIKERNRILSDDVAASGTSLYNGTVNFIADSFEDGFRLNEALRGNGIYTLDAQNSTDFFDAIEFVDEDGDFTSVWDRPGVSVHWAAEKSYDYYLATFNWDSYNNLGGSVYSYAHFDTGLSNAFWDGSQMLFGDGDGINTTPFGALDVVGHEFTHGVTQWSAGLIYESEYGALNESFSDIFGTVIEFNVEGTDGDWLIGEDVIVGNGSIRSMANPDLWNMPDTYQGENWIDPDCVPDGTNDFCGVHTNSSVQNHWFFLLSQGGEGTNDNDENYFVEGVGIFTATDIAFQNLTNYLGPTSEYVDAGVGSRDAAIDLHGVRTRELNTVANAWYAVGVTDAANLVLDNGDVITTGTSHTAASSISAGDYTIDEVGGVELFAGSQIIISPPFKAEPGSEFRASIFARSAPPVANARDALDESVAAVTVEAAGLQNEIEQPQTETPNSLLAIPEHHLLDQNYPNPFNPTTSIRYGLKETAHVSLKIYDMLGRLVRTLQHDTQSAGYYNLEWDGRNDAGEHVASGQYLYRIDIKNLQSTGVSAYIKTRKLLLLR